MVWALAIVAVIAFAMAFTTRSVGFLAVCLFVGFVCAIAAALIFIDRHVRASSRPEHMTPRELEALRAMMRKREDATRQLPHPNDE